MRKVQLNVADLTVESFGTVPVDAERGTVLGRQVSAASGCYTCDGWVTQAPGQPCVICG